MLTLLSNNFFRSSIIEYEDDQSKDLLDCLFSTEKDMNPLKDLLERNDWKKFRYKIELNITGTSYPANGTLQRTLSNSDKTDINGPSQTFETWTAIGSFSFLHMVIIAQKIKVLKYLIDNYKGDTGEFLKKYRTKSISTLTKNII